MIVLENWSIMTDDSNLFVAPELRERVLVGDVYGHDRFEEGKNVRTSVLKSVDIEEGIAKTRNTTYTLGKVSKEMEEFLESNENNTIVEGD